MNSYDKKRLDDLIQHTIQLHYSMTTDDENQLRDFADVLKEFLYDNRQYKYHNYYARSKLLYTYLKKNLDYYDNLKQKNLLIHMNVEPFLMDVPLVKPRVWD